MDPKTVIIHGDLSRADVEVLVKLCKDKNVVEFGMGGSTLILAQCAKSLLSYDTDKQWLERTKRRLKDCACTPVLELTSGVPDDIPNCDVLFIDGNGNDRHKWLKFFPKCNILICHDSLGDTGQGPTLYHVMAELFMNRECLEFLDKAEYHMDGSNMAVMWRRNTPIKFQNWNETEPEGRLNPWFD